MSFKSVLLGTAAAAILATSAPFVLPERLNPVATAKAQDVSFSISIFYDELDPYGDWVLYRGGYVFIPTGVAAGWRPYTAGRWVYTKRYGWMWVSDEPFGWATYHYGRWGYASDIGWYWVPGTVWAPAWVTWKRSPDYVVWAPLPPDGSPDVVINITIATVPDFYWVALPARSFLEVNLNFVIVKDRDLRRRIIRQARDEGRVRRQGDIVINNIIDIDFVEQRTGKRVREVEVRKADKPGKARIRDGEIVAFDEKLAPARDKKPREIKNVRDVKLIRAEEEEEDTTGTTQPPQGKESVEGSPEEPPATRKRRPLAEEQEEAVTQPTRRQRQRAQEQPAAEEEGEAVTPPARRQRQRAEQPEEAAPAPRRQRPRIEEQVEPGQARPERRRGRPVCDPNVDPNCPPQQ